ncbi:MAG: hypothetical protein P8Z81_12650 [Deinococcales bacterium]
MALRSVGTLLAFAFVGWALCAATMGIGMATMSERNAMLVHVVLAPVFFVAVSSVYFRRVPNATPWLTAVGFVAVVMVVDFVVVAVIIYRSLAMFTSPLGTWIPFGLIFLATYVTGLALTRAASRGRAKAL